MVDVAQILSEDGHEPVTLPSGAEFHVHLEEKDYFEERRDKYLADNKFTNISDMQDIDRMLIMEVLVWRWGRWLSTGRDYWGEPVDANQIQRHFSDYSKELRQLKQSLGIDKITRDKQRGEDSVEAYIENLRVRAKAFGVMREKQLDKALELMNDIKAQAIFYQNCDERERVEQGCTAEKVLEWIIETVIPAYDAIDEHFRENDQRYWIRQM